MNQPGEDVRVGDVMRNDYRILSTEEKMQIKLIKDLGNDFISTLNGAEGPNDLPVKRRAFALARTKMEEAVMWAVKGFTS